MISQLYDVGAFLGIAVAIFGLNALLFRPLMMGNFDPAWFVAIFSTLTLSLLEYEHVVNRTINSSEMLYVWACFGAFIGFAQLANALLKGPSLIRTRTPATLPALNMGDANFVRVFLILSTAIVGAAFGYRALTYGVPIFQSDPEAARVLANKGGLGLISRVIQPLLYSNCVLLFYAMEKRLDIRRWWSITCLVVTVVILLLSGYKAILIVVFIAYFCARTYAYMLVGVRYEFVSWRVVVFTIMGALGFTYIVVFLRMAGLGIGDPSNAAFTQTVLRIMQHGLGASYFFSNHLELLVRKPAQEYAWSFIIVPFLAPFRVVPYDSQSLGQLLGQIMTGSDLFGPNPSMYVEGIVYFGRVGGVLYCGALGAMYSIFRSSRLASVTRNEAIQALLFGAANLVVLYSTMDMLVVIGDIVNYLMMFCVIVPFAFIVSCVAASDLSKAARAGRLHA